MIQRALKLAIISIVKVSFLFGRNVPAGAPFVMPCCVACFRWLPSRQPSLPSPSVSLLRITNIPVVVFSADMAYLQPTGTEDYVPAGVMAVPRSQQVSAAVFEQEENLKAVSGCFVLVRRDCCCCCRGYSSAVIYCSYVVHVCRERLPLLLISNVLYSRCTRQRRG